MIDAPLDAILDNKFKGFYRAIVLDNDDPKKLGRVKVDHPVYEGVPLSERPWAMRILPTYPSSKGTFAIPRVGDEIVLIFLDGSIYTPAYLGYLTDEAWGHDPDEYPDDHGWKDAWGNDWHVRPKKAKKATFVHQTGSILEFRDDGTIYFKPAGPSKTLVIDGKLHVMDTSLFEKDVTMNANLSVAGSTSIGRDLSVGGNAVITGNMRAIGGCCCAGMVPQPISPC